MASASASASASTAGGEFLAPNPLPVRGKPLRMHASPDGSQVAYGYGNAVVLRSVSDLTQASLYLEHSAHVLCAAFSPDGKLVASGDAKGEVRVWSVADAGHPTKSTLGGLPGGVLDIAWDATGALLALAGHGKDKARIMTADSGTDMGELKTLAKPCLAIAASAAAPSRFAYGGEDKQVLLYEGRPAKFVAQESDHGGFVNAVAFSPSGELLVSTGADKALIVRNGNTGAALHKTAAAHKGSVYNAVFSPAGDALATSSADKTVKLWSVAADGAVAETGQAVIGKSIPDMQNGLVWPRADRLFSVSLCGTLHVIDPASATVTESVAGHPGEVTTMAGADGVILTADGTGAACLWARGDAGAGFAGKLVSGAGHKKRVRCCDIAAGRFVTGGMDDTLCFGDVASGAFSCSGKVGSMPRGVAILPGRPEVAVVATSKVVKSFNTATGAELASVPAPWEGRAIAASPDGSAVFVGAEDGTVRRFDVDAAGGLAEAAATAASLGSAVSSIDVSPDGEHVAVGIKAREVVVLAAGTLSPEVKTLWKAHGSDVTALKWSPDGTRIASTGVDQHVFVWRMGESLPVKRCHLAVRAPAVALAWETDGSSVWVTTSAGVTGRVSVSE